jgi:hypothetical protein
MSALPAVRRPYSTCLFAYIIPKSCHDDLEIMDTERMLALFDEEESAE